MAHVTPCNDTVAVLTAAIRRAVADLSAGPARDPKAIKGGGLTARAAAQWVAPIIRHLAAAADAADASARARADGADRRTADPRQALYDFLAAEFRPPLESELDDLVGLALADHHAQVNALVNALARADHRTRGVADAVDTLSRECVRVAARLRFGTASGDGDADPLIRAADAARGAAAKAVNL